MYANPPHRPARLVGWPLSLLGALAPLVLALPAPLVLALPAPLLLALPAVAAEETDITLPFRRREAARHGEWCSLAGRPAPPEGGSIAFGRDDAGQVQLALTLPRRVPAPAAGTTVRLQLRLTGNGNPRPSLTATVQPDGRLIADIPAEFAAAFAAPPRVLAVVVPLRAQTVLRYRMDEDPPADERFRACLASARPVAPPAVAAPAAQPAPAIPTEAGTEADPGRLTPGPQGVATAASPVPTPGPETPDGVAPAEPVGAPGLAEPTPAQPGTPAPPVAVASAEPARVAAAVLPPAAAPPPPPSSAPAAPASGVPPVAAPASAPLPRGAVRRILENWRVEAVLGCTMAVTADGVRGSVSVIPLTLTRQAGMLQLFAADSRLVDNRNYELVFAGAAGAFRLTAIANAGALATFLKRGGRDDVDMASEFAGGGSLEIRDAGRVVEAWQIAPAPESVQRGLQRCLAALPPL